MGQGAPLKAKSYAGKNHFGKYYLCAMNDLVHYLRYVLCLEIVDVPSF